jgi:AraC-like DNA-binding protein
VSLATYVQVARFVGLDPHKMLRRAGIRPDALADPEHLLPAGPVTTLLNDSARESGCMSFGLLMAESRSLESVGAVSLLLKHQGTARDVIDALIRYQRLMAEAVAFSTEERGETVILRTEIAADRGGRQSVELLMGMVYRIVSAIVSGRWRPESAHFVHDAPADLSVHRRIFQCPLIFESGFNGFTCSAGSLDAPNPAADSVMARHAQRYLEMLLPKPADGSITERARRSLYLLLPAGRATLEQLGENLGVHPRALQRTLDKEGRTFATLLNEVRRELALRYLSGSAHSVTAIAQMTGYASPSSFTRWFCAEFGMAPAAWRAEERQERAAPGGKAQ